MTETHVIFALRAKRAEVSGDIHDLEKKLKTSRAGHTYRRDHKNLLAQD